MVRRGLFFFEAIFLSTSLLTESITASSAAGLVRPGGTLTAPWESTIMGGTGIALKIEMKHIVCPVILSAIVGLCGGLHAEQSSFPAETFIYKSVEGIALKADVYRREGLRSRPVLLWIHGGGLIVGSRAHVPSDLLDLCRVEDFVLVSIDYRLAPEASLDSVLRDVTDAVQWIRDDGPRALGADPSRLVVAGASAGGYLSLALGYLARPAPTALVSYWGYGSLEWYLEPSSYYRNNAPLIDRVEARTLVGQSVFTNTSPDTVRPRWRYYIYLRQTGLWAQEVAKAATAGELEAYSPARHVERDYPPTLLLHGTDDEDVPFEQSQSMARALSGLGIPSRLIAVPGAGHDLHHGDEKDVAQARRAAIEFIKKHLLEMQ